MTAMSPSSFYGWLRGFAQGIEMPTPEQWATIKEQLAQVDKETKPEPFAGGGNPVPPGFPFIASKRITP